MTTQRECLARVPAGLNTQLWLVGKFGEVPYFLQTRETFMMTGSEELVSDVLPHIGAVVLDEMNRIDDSVETIARENSTVPSGWNLHVRRPGIVNPSDVSEDPVRAICSTFSRYRRQSRLAIDPVDHVIFSRAPLGVDYSVRGKKSRTWVVPRLTVEQLPFEEGYKRFDTLPQRMVNGQRVVDVGGGATFPEHVHTLLSAILLQRSVNCRNPEVVVVAEYIDPLTGKQMVAFPR